MNTNDTKESTWTIEEPADLAFPVLHVYPRQNDPQPAFIEIDFENKRVRASWNAEIGNAVPMDVYLGKTHRLAISAWTTRSTVKKMLNEVAEVIEDIAEGYETRWNGNNERGQLSAESVDMMDDLFRVLNVYETAIASEWSDFWEFAVEQKDAELARVLGQELPNTEQNTVNWEQMMSIEKAAEASGNWKIGTCYRWISGGECTREDAEVLLLYHLDGDFEPLERILEELEVNYFAPALGTEPPTGAGVTHSWKTLANWYNDGSQVAVIALEIKK